MIYPCILFHGIFPAKQDTQALKEKSAPIGRWMSKACVLPVAVKINVFETRDVYRAACGIKAVGTDQDL